MQFQIGQNAWGAEPDCELTFDATQSNVRFALQMVRDFLGRRDLNDLQDRVELVLGEVLNNVEEHAYRGQGGVVHVKLSSKPEGVTISTKDWGVAMPGGRLPTRDMPDLKGVALEDLPEGGFGWALIREITSDLRYTRASDENRLDFSIDC